MLGMIFQVQGKTWVTTKDIGSLIDALDAIFQPQANLCSFGDSKTIPNIRQFLRLELG
jgi:hypothetical protein